MKTNFYSFSTHSPDLAADKADACHNDFGICPVLSRFGSTDNSAHSKW